MDAALEGMPAVYEIGGREFLVGMTVGHLQAFVGLVQLRRLSAEARGQLFFAVEGGQVP